jgi:hypothetical protein
MPEVSNDEEHILLYTIRLDVPKRFSSADKEYYQYVKKGQSEYRIRMKKSIKDEEYIIIYKQDLLCFIVK